MENEQPKANESEHFTDAEIDELVDEVRRQYRLLREREQADNPTAA